MTITAIKEQVKNPERVSVFVDGKFTFSLTISQLVEAKLRRGLDLSAEDIAAYKKMSAMGKRRMKVLNWVTLRPRSSGELRTYIRMKLRPKPDQKGSNDVISSDEAADLQDYMLTKGYVDDRRFAEWWLGRRTSQAKSAYQLKSELSLKGVESSIISEFLSEDQNTEALVLQIQKLRNRSKYRQEPDKLVAFLMRKGFRYSEITLALEAAGE